MKLAIVGILILALATLGCAQKASEEPPPSSPESGSQDQPIAEEDFESGESEEFTEGTEEPPPTPEE